MLKEALPFINEIKVINYDPAEQVSFKNQFIQGKMLKSTPRVSTLFVGDCVFSDSTIPTHATINNSLLLNCSVFSPTGKTEEAVWDFSKIYVDGKFSPDAFNDMTKNVPTEFRSSVPIVSFRKCRMIDGKGVFQKISNSFFENVFVTLIGKSDGTVFKNCVIMDGNLQSCEFVNCILTNCTITNCTYDENTRLDTSVKEIGGKKEKGFFNLKEVRSVFK